MAECGLVLVLVGKEVDMWILVSVRPPSVVRQVLGSLVVVHCPEPSFLRQGLELWQAYILVELLLVGWG